MSTVTQIDAMIRNARHGGAPIVVRTTETPDAEELVDETLRGMRCDGVEYREVHLAARYGIRGAHLEFDEDDEQALFEQLVDDETALQIVVTVDADFAIDALTLIPVIGQIGAEVRAQANLTGRYVDVAEIVWILDEPAVELRMAS